MKNLLIMILCTIITFTAIFTFGNKVIRSNKIVPEKTLEISTPFNGKIDLEFLVRYVKPAYE